MFDFCISGTGLGKGRIFSHGSTKDRRLMGLFFPWAPALKPVSQHGSRREMLAV